MPYADRLLPMICWLRQVWAESLGKGGHGSTPVRAAGTLDQHSQLQLYLDGPRDKLFTFFALKKCHPERSEGSHAAGDPSAFGLRMTAPFLQQDPSLRYMYGRTLEDIIEASERATRETVVKNGRPVRSITLDRLDEKTLGALAAHFMLETVIAARMLNVNPFDQPAVEEGKALTRKYLQER